MHSMILLAYAQTGSSTWDGIVNMAVSALINSVVYALIFKVMHDLTLPQALVVVAVVFGGLYFWSRARDRRG